MPIGPSRPLNLAKPESIDIRQAARYFGAQGEADSATLTLLKKCAAPLLAAATPRAVWLEADVESLTPVSYTHLGRAGVGVYRLRHPQHRQRGLP